MTMHTKLLPMKYCHVPEVVHVHMESFPGFFLTFLGPKFLYVFYRELLKSYLHVAFVAIDSEDRVVGFVAGVTQQDVLYNQFLHRSWLRFALATSSAVFRRPAIVPRLLRTLTYPQRSRKFAAPASLMSLAVLPSYNRQGIGKSLVLAFLQAMSQKRIHLISLTTDKVDNQDANLFYEKLGFRVVQIHRTPDGRLMNEYLINTKL